jgi:flavodoxin I
MKALIVYGSLLGKTARIADLIGEALQENNIDTTVKDVRETNVFELSGYQLVILASSTWDDGQLQFDFRPFDLNVRKNNFSGKNFAIFVLGSHKYPHPFGAATILEETVKLIQGNLIIPTLTLDIDHDEPEDKLDEEALFWAGKVVESIAE